MLNITKSAMAALEGVNQTQVLTSLARVKELTLRSRRTIDNYMASRPPMYESRGFRQRASPTTMSSDVII
jgi:hypothetical protein